MIRVIAIMAACSPVVRLPRGPIPIAVVVPVPGAPKPSCWLDAPPKPPDQPEISHDVSQDMIDRFYVHFRDYTKLIEWAHDVEIENAQLRDCLQKLVAP